MFNSLLSRAQLALAAVFLLLLGISAAGMLALNNISRDYEQLLQQEIEQERLIVSVAVDFNAQIQAWNYLMIRGFDFQQHNFFWDQFQTLEQDITDALTSMIEVATERDLPRLEEFLSQYEEMARGYHEGYEIYSAGLDMMSADNAVEGLNAAPAAELEQLAAHFAQAAAQRSDDLQRRAQLGLLLTLGVLLASVALIFLGSSFVMRRLLIQPMTRLIREVEMLAQGVFDHTIPYTDRRDELGQLALTARSLQGHLSQSAHSMITAVDGLKDQSAVLAASSTSIQSGSDEQSQQADQVATAMHQMVASVQQIAQNSNEVSVATDSARQVASEGGTEMTQAAAGMEQLEQKVNSLSQKLEQLIKDTDRVGDMAQVIGDIAEQTNLLALNAAIESARAGEHGRGFAVVADEVRSLAGRTQQSTREISEVIESVQSGASAVITAMKDSLDETAAAVGRVNEGRHSLDKIIGSVDIINDLATQVAAGAEEQGKVAESINRNLTVLAEVASRTRDQSSQISGSIQELGDIAQEIDTSVSTLTRGAA